MTNVIAISEAEADTLILIEEGQFSDVKAKEITPAKLSRTISAFANTDGGDLYIGVGDQKLGGNVAKRIWNGFGNIEAANGHMQAFEKVFPLGKDFQYEFLRCDRKPGIVLHVQVMRTQGIAKSTDGIAYLRRGAQNLPQTTADEIRRLEFQKGVCSFESNTVRADKDLIVESSVTSRYLSHVTGKSYRLRNKSETATAEADENSKPAIVHAGKTARTRAAKAASTEPVDEKQAVETCKS